MEKQEGKQTFRHQLRGMAFGNAKRLHTQGSSLARFHPLENKQVMDTHTSELQLQEGAERFKAVVCEETVPYTQLYQTPVHSTNRGTIHNRIITQGVLSIIDLQCRVRTILFITVPDSNLADNHRLLPSVDLEDT